MDVEHFVPDDLVIGEADYASELLTADLTGTAGSVTDTTTYAVSDQDTLTEIVTVSDGSGESWDGVAQTVTFDGATTTALQVAAQMNDQLDGCSVMVTGGHVVITTDAKGPDCSVAIGTGTCGLTWAAAVAGTGTPATWPKGTLLARNSSTKKFVPYVDSGSNDTDEPRAVVPNDITFTATGDQRERILKGGKVIVEQLSKLSDATAIDVLVLDKLRANTGIVPISARDHSAYDNE